MTIWTAFEDMMPCFKCML